MPATGAHRIGFGESVQWQMTPNKNARDKVNGDFRDGIFLGVIWRTTEYLIGTPEGIFKCNTVKPRIKENAYDPACITLWPDTSIFSHMVSIAPCGFMPVTISWAE